MKDIPGYEGLYAATEEGKVWSFPKGRWGHGLGNKFVGTSVDQYGYPCGNFRKKNKGKTIRIHRLIAKTFLPNPLELKEVNHINGIKTDNRVENLEWCSGLENIRHAHRSGLISPSKGERNGSHKLKTNQVREIRLLREQGWSLPKLGKKFGVSHVTIRAISLRLPNGGWTSVE